MEQAEVIDIDDLLGSGTPLVSRGNLHGQHDAEEYDFENFAVQGDPQPADTETSNVVPNTQTPSNESEQQAKKERPARRKSSLEEDFKRLFVPSKSRKGEVPEESQADNHTSKKKEYSAAKASHSESLVDALVQGELSDAMLSEEELCIDVNSEELRQFILEFENEDVPLSVSDQHGPRSIMVIRSDDQDSLNSSISTTESRDGSLTSSLASSLASSNVHLSPARSANKPKTHRGKSVRFLVSNLLRNNKAGHHSRHSGSDEDNKRTPTRPKDRSRKKEDREKMIALKQHSKANAVSSKTVTKSAAPRGPAVLNTDMQSRNQTMMATPLNPGARVNNTLPRQLIQAAARGDLQVLEFLLAANEGLSKVRDNRGNTLLHAVARRGHADCLAWLASSPCNSLLTVENDDCFTAAALAVKHGQMECTKWLVCHSEARSELHAQDNRWSLLHLAARFGQEPCLRWMLEHMQTADILQDQTDHTQNSPAHLAAKYGHLQCLQTLVEFNCDVTLQNKKRQSPCTLATRYHHDTCAQFLVVVETCIKLSEELTVTQRQLRESQQEKHLISKKLKEAMSCTDALIHIQKTDLSRRIEQVRGEYVDLTNLLVRQLDQVHRHQTESVGHDLVSISRENVLACKQKASQLEHACSELLDLDHHQQKKESNKSQLLEIERRLSRLQPLPTSPIWPSEQRELSQGFALDSMRNRLGEVNHQISTLHHVSPSLTSENLDTLSLSSSYASSSLSSSTSSLQTGMVQTSPKHSVKKRRVSWNEPSQNGAAGNEKELAQATRSNPQNAKGQSNECIPLNVSRDIQGQQYSLLQTSQVDPTDFTSVQYPEVVRDGNIYSKHEQAARNVIQVEAIINHQTLPAQSHDLGKSVDKGHRSETQEDTSGRSVISMPSYNESKASLSKNSVRVESLSSASDSGKQKPKRNPDETQHYLDQTDLKSSRTEPSVQENKKLREILFVPSFDNLSKTLDHVQQSNMYPSQKLSPQAMPDFMRKVQPTNEFGEPEAGKVVVKISNREEMVLLPPEMTEDGDRLSVLIPSHRRLNSNSSVSSTFSDHPWSDLEESPRLNRTHKGGILCRKSSDGRKPSQDRHIKFALDDQHEDASSTGRGMLLAGGKLPQAVSNRRDLSPIYEAPDLVKSTKDDSKSQNRTSLSSGKTDSKELSEAEKRSLMGGNNYHLFSYSSDEGDHDMQEDKKTSKTSNRREDEKLKYPNGLTDMISLEFNGIMDDEDDSHQEDEEMQDKLWYESSSNDDDEDEEDSQCLRASSQGGFERHICYL